MTVDRGSTVRRGDDSPPAREQPGSGVAIVSGGSRGLGRVVVERLLAEGWRVATFSRGGNEFTAAAERAFPESFHWEAADLSDPTTMRVFARSVRRRFGGVELLVNNAGAVHEELLLTTPLPKIDSLVTVNLVAPIALAQASARMMSRRGDGVIINVSSVNAIRGYRGVCVYAAAKAGLEGFSRSLARELATFGIRVNCVVPGYFDSAMTAEITAQERLRIVRRTPLGRLADAAEVADAILFLSSPQAKFITGQSLVVDGGITC